MGDAEINARTLSDLTLKIKQVIDRKSATKAELAALRREFSDAQWIRPRSPRDVTPEWQAMQEAWDQLSTELRIDAERAEQGHGDAVGKLMALLLD
jgi:hypothetical protein